MGGPQQQEALSTNQKVVVWARGHLGKKIGRGLCWDLGEQDLASAQREYEERERASASHDRGVLRMEREAKERARNQREARLAAGMGFWRLVLIVAPGVLLAQVFGGIALAVLRTVMGTPS